MTAALTSRRGPRRVMRALARHLAPVQPRRLLVAAGRRLSPRQLTGLRTALGALEQGSWIGGLEARVPNRGDRFAVFAEIVERVRSPRPLYLEFGVHEGRTLRWWSEHLTAPGARMIGFDSFDGLPGDWHADAPAGSFATGRVPQIDDPRVEIVPGWFSDTLPGRVLPPHDELVVNVDCDLYSSTREVLDWLEGHLRPGTLVYFDDLFDHDAELRAVWEWVDAHPETVRPLSMARWGQHLLLEYRRPDLDPEAPPNGAIDGAAARFSAPTPVSDATDGGHERAGSLPSGDGQLASRRATGCRKDDAVDGPPAPTR